MGRTVEHIKIVEEDLRRGCRIKNSPTLRQGFKHCMETPFATPDAKSCFCFPCLWQSKRKKKGRSGTDHQWVWDTAEDEPEYPDRRLR